MLSLCFLALLAYWHAHASFSSIHHCARAQPIELLACKYNYSLALKMIFWFVCMLNKQNICNKFDLHET